MILSFILQFKSSISSTIGNKLGSNILKCGTIIFKYTSIFLHKCNNIRVNLYNKFVYYHIILKGDKRKCKEANSIFPFSRLYRLSKCVCNITFSCTRIFSKIEIVL